MGYYINKDSQGKELPMSRKAAALIADGGKGLAQTIQGVPEGGFQENLICVVDNGIFEAAGYIFNENEYEAFTLPNDHRPKKWLTHPKAKEISGY